MRNSKLFVLIIKHTVHIIVYTYRPTCRPSDFYKKLCFRRNRRYGGTSIACGGGKIFNRVRVRVFKIKTASTYDCFKGSKIFNFYPIIIEESIWSCLSKAVLTADFKSAIFLV